MRIGLDLGGTKIECIALGAGGEVLFRRRAPTPREDYEATIRTLVELVEACERETGAGGRSEIDVRGRSETDAHGRGEAGAGGRGEGESAGDRRVPVGLGHPGAISPATGLIKNANSVWLNGRPLAQDLERALRRRCRLANDANCFALSEAIDGAAAGARVVFGVIIGTGTGGGLVVDGRVLTGPNAIAGEWGHNPMPWPKAGEWPGPPCYCGRSGCIETFLSGPGMSRDHGSGAAGDADERGPFPTPEQIVSLAAAGDGRAEGAVRRYVDRMARALAGVINLCDPDAIVLGGGMSNIDRLYNEVPRLWGTWVFSDRVDTPLLRAKHGDSSGVRGAAWLWPEE